MIIFKNSNDLYTYLARQKTAGFRTGFVPTMGALHAGHISLVEQCHQSNDLVICSIFINPTQFNNAVDLEKYPVTLEADIDKLEKAGCDLLFMPSRQEIYPEGFTFRQYPLGYLEQILEGKYRPGHFQGVCQVVHRLLDIVRPHQLILGEKDFQQCHVLKKLIEILEIPVDVVIHPTVREQDGLAMSSRNLRLNIDQRKTAPLLFNGLSKLAQVINGNNDSLVESSIRELNNLGFKVDYLVIADAETLLPPGNETARKVILAAAYLGEIRLIDNIVLN